jgi:hypothetical protein
MLGFADLGATELPPKLPPTTRFNSKLSSGVDTEGDAQRRPLVAQLLLQTNTPHDGGILRRSNAASVLACPRLFSRRPACDSSGNAIDESRPAYHVRRGMHSWRRASRQNPSSSVRVLSRGSRTSSRLGCVDSKRSGNGPPGSGSLLACRSVSLECRLNEREFTRSRLHRADDRSASAATATRTRRIGE